MCSPSDGRVRIFLKRFSFFIRQFFFLSKFKIEEDMIEAFQEMESNPDLDDEDLIEELCLNSGICTSAHHDEL